MEFVVKKTTELDTIEKASLLDCFIDVFEHERTLEELCNQYINTPMGYCIHSLCIDDGRVVAALTAFPSYYYVASVKYKAFITGDNMVRKEYRDGAVFLDVSLGLFSYMKKDGYAFSFGFPNENAYAVNKRGRLAVEIGRLDTYILPYRIGGIKRGFGLFNPFSKMFCELWLLFSGLNLNEHKCIPIVHKDDNTYNLVRYKRMDGKYNYVNQEGLEFYYKIKDHDGVRTAFLIDVVGKSEKTIHEAVKYILRNKKKEFDLLMYVGHLPDTIKNIGLIRVPRRYEPKHFYMMGKLYDKNIDANILLDINNWDVNLSDYDLI